MKKINLISSVEAHLLVDKAILSTLYSLKESPLKSIREAAEYWEKKLSESSAAELNLSSDIRRHRRSCRVEEDG